MRSPALHGFAHGVVAYRLASVLALWALAGAWEVHAADEALRSARVPPVVIHGVELDISRDRDRVLIFGEDRFRYRVVGTDSETIEIQIPHAVLDESAVSRVEPDVVGTVSRVTIFERRLESATEVRIVIRRREGVAPEVVQRGAMLAVDFARPRVEEKLVLQVRDADIRDVAERVARASGMELIFDESLAGNVTITTGDEITPAEAVELLNAVLLLEGFAAVSTPSGALKIVGIESAPASAPWTEHAETDGSSTLATLLRPKRADASELANAMAPFIDEATLVRSVGASNALILAGATPRVRRALELARLLDDSAGEHLFVRRLRHLDANRAAELLLEALGDEIRDGGRIDAWSAPRSNDVVVRGPAELLPRARSFLRRIDTPAPGGGWLKVIPVLHADPEELGQVLRDLAGGDGQPVDVGGVLMGRSFQLTVDRPTSSLVVIGDPETVRLVSDVAAELDQERPQIDLEVLIFEVTTIGSLELGFDAIIPFGNPPDGDLFGSVLLNPTGGGLQAEGGDQSLFARIQAEPILVPIVGPDGNPLTMIIPQETVVVLADENAIHTHVLMRPHLTMSSGEEQEIFAGENIPVPVSRVEEAGALPLEVRSNIEREDVGVRVRVRPTLGQRSEVLLDLNIEDRRVVQSAAGDVENVGPTFQQRQLDTSVRLVSGEIVVIGMAEQAVDSDVEVGTPFLRHVPGLGALFRSNRSRQLKRQLVIAVQAKVLPGSQDLLAQSIRRRIAFERRLARVEALEHPEDAPYAVRVDTSRSIEEMRTLVEDLRAAGSAAQISTWSWEGDMRHDVYITGFTTLPEAGEMALRLRRDGFDPELTVIPDAPR